jgi:hypothetical protein
MRVVLVLIENIALFYRHLLTSLLGRRDAARFVDP